MNKKTYLSVVIPCYNESENLKRGVLDEVFEFLKKQKYSWELIISDDGSTDNSLKLARSFARGKKNVRVLANKHGGKPWAVSQGIKVAKGEIILFTDMDQSTPIKEIRKLLPFFPKYDVVIGSRGFKRKGYAWYRQLGSPLFRIFRGMLILPKINDTQCGFKAFKSPVAKKIFPQLHVLKDLKNAKGWKVTAFDVELLFIAQKKGYSIKEVVVDWKDEDVAKGKKRSYFKESRKMLEQIVTVRINDFKGLYEK